MTTTAPAVPAAPAVTHPSLTFGAVTVTRAVESVGSIGMTPEQFFPGTAASAWAGHEELLRPHHLLSDGESVMDSTARVPELDPPLGRHDDPAGRSGRRR